MANNRPELLDPEVAERRRKQRELKRRFRQRKRNDREELQQQLQTLEACYNQLYAARMTQTSSVLELESLSFDTNNCTSRSMVCSPSSVSVLPSVLQQRYEDSKREMEHLRAQIAAMRLRMESFDRFVSNIDGYLIGLRSPAPRVLESKLPAPPRRNPRTATIMTEAECQRIVQQCYRDICERKWPDECVSTGSHILGWADKRCIEDDATLHFAFSKRFAFASAHDFMVKTWDIVTSEKLQHVRCVQKSTLGIKVLQVINDDMMLVQRRVYHAHLSTVSCLNMLAFRMRTLSGYILAYKGVKLPEYETHDAFMYDAEQKSQIRDDPELKHVWVESFHWWIFEEEDNGPDEEEEELVRFSDAEIDRLFIGSEGDSEDAIDSSGLNAAMGVASSSSSSPSPSQRSKGLSVTLGGVTKNPDVHYIGYFLVEIVSCVIRWEGVVGPSRLTFLDLSEETE